MTYTVLWSNTALDQAARYLKDDPDGLPLVFEFTDLLAQEPRPATASPVGRNRYRHRVGLYRIVYEIHDEQIVVEVIHLGRAGM